MSLEIPLFPLNTVLFPGAPLPLHVFEERYKLMIGRCIQEERPFGVVLIKKGNEVGETAEPFEVGTTAHIARVDRLEEGRMHLLCLGGKRFRICAIEQQFPYFVAQVDLLDEQVETDGETVDLAATAGRLFAEYMRVYLAMTNQWARTVELPEDAGGLADHIGSRLSVSLWTKQRILEELSARKRLEIEVHILSEAVTNMTPRVDAARATRWRGFAMQN